MKTSVRARLEAKARERGTTFHYASLLYMQEGFLARLAASPHADKLILKGGFLLFSTRAPMGRTTRDIDFLGEGLPNEETSLVRIVA
ncbi:MAG TPA: nucleotidyl transferase AbiEii/AbiGii toxin family protein, partial [Spirochaetia bacterium]|nr:nucleotidyl transferase AbiEii/AbiGii toxin family protein [Spirochaetia bacterium]